MESSDLPAIPARGNRYGSGAIIGLDQRYRYFLWRDFDMTLPSTLGIIMLNPSTADATKDDATIRRCINLARANGFGSIEVANLFAFRATHPRDLPADNEEAIGPANRTVLDNIYERATTVVAAWGCGPRQHRVHVTGEMQCWGMTHDGCPRHPLYVPRGTALQNWTPGRIAI